MHGNTIMTADGTKTRRLEDMKAELIRYFAIHRAFGTWPGGVHLEVTGQDVTECIGGNVERPLPARYETRCDPRLNPAQAQELAALAAAEFAKGPNAA
jgi:3-deoxy-7-phosphoheptulonate synthase